MGSDCEGVGSVLGCGECVGVWAVSVEVCGECVSDRVSCVK